MSTINHTNPGIQPQFPMSVNLSSDWPYASQWATANGGAPLGRSFYLWPSNEDGFTEPGANPSYTQTEVPGRVEPYQTFTGNDSREFSVTLQFTAETPGTTEPTTSGSFTLFDVSYWPRWFTRLEQSFYDQSAQVWRAPPPVILRVGDLLRARCVVKVDNIRWLPPFQPLTLYPFNSEIDITFTVVRTDIPLPSVVPELNEYTELPAVLSTP